MHLLAYFSFYCFLRQLFIGAFQIVARRAAPVGVPTNRRQFEMNSLFIGIITFSNIHYKQK